MACGVPVLPYPRWDRTCVLVLGGRSLNRWTTREFPVSHFFLTRHLWRTLGTRGCGCGSHQLGTCQLQSSCTSCSGASDRSTRGGGTCPQTPGRSEPGMLVVTLVCASGGHVNQLLLSNLGQKNSFLLTWDLTRCSPRLSTGRRPSAVEAATCGQVRMLPASRRKQEWDGPNACQVPGSLQPAPATCPTTGLDKLIHSPPSLFFPCLNPFKFPSLPNPVLMSPVEKRSVPNGSP